MIINNLPEGLRSTQLKQLQCVARMYLEKERIENRQWYVEYLIDNGVDFNILVENMSDRNKLLIFGTTDYFRITGAVNPFENVIEEKVLT